MSDEEQQPQQQGERRRLTHLSGNLGKGGVTVIKSDKVDTGEIVKFSLGVPVTNGSKENPGETFWCDISIFDSKMGARAKEELKQGDKVLVIGYLGSREWTDKEGNTRTNAQMTAQRISHLEFWEKDPYVPREQVSQAADFQAPF